MPRGGRNKENEVGYHYVGYMRSQKTIVKNLLNAAVVTSTDSTPEAEPSKKKRSAKPSRSKFHTDILESEEEDIPSPAYSPHLSKKETSRISKIIQSIIEKRGTENSRAHKRPKKKKNEETLIIEKNDQKVELKAPPKKIENTNKGTRPNKVRNGQKKEEKTKQLTLREYFSQWRC